MRNGLQWRHVVVVLAMLALFAGGCQVTDETEDDRAVDRPVNPRMTVAATFPDRQVTGVAVGPDGRLFVNFPRWMPPHDISVALVRPDGELVPSPNAQWNEWSSGMDPGRRFVSVQALWADRAGHLWILDPAAPGLGRVVEGGPKLVQVDLATDRIERIYRFGRDVAPENSYLNDVRVDVERQYAYITDSGASALVVLNLRTGEARRVLDTHPSTMAEDIPLIVAGQPLRTPQGQTPRIHADGIALSPDGRWLYYHALTGRMLWRVPTAVLRNFELPESRIAEAVERVAETVVTDGMIMDRQGNIYHTALEQDAIIAYDVRTNELWTLIESPRLAWPDSLAFGPDGDLYVTTSRIHEMPRFNEGRDVRTQPYRVYRIHLSEARVD